MCIQKCILNSNIIANIEVCFIQMQCVIEAFYWVVIIIVFKFHPILRRCVEWVYGIFLVLSEN